MIDLSKQIQKMGLAPIFLSLLVSWNTSSAGQIDSGPNEYSQVAPTVGDQLELEKMLRPASETEFIFYQATQLKEASEKNQCENPVYEKKECSKKIDSGVLFGGAECDESGRYVDCYYDVVCDVSYESPCPDSVAGCGGDIRTTRKRAFKSFLIWDGPSWACPLAAVTAAVAKCPFASDYNEAAAKLCSEKTETRAVDCKNCSTRR